MRLADVLLQRRAVQALWFLVFVSLLIWFAVPHYVWLWDLQIYKTAVLSVRAGHDPYLDGMGIQQAFHTHFAEHPHATPPYTYVYSPITLILLKAIARSNLWASGVLYGLAYVVGVGLILRFGLDATTPGERPLFRLLAPISLFFPALLHQDTLLSGNVALIFYGFVLASTTYGVKRGRWLPFYVFVVLASCFKAPLLSLLVIPLLCGRRQIAATLVSAAAGVWLFVLQPLLWPVAFRHFLAAVDLQFQFNRDFGSSPAGVVADLLFKLAPYQVVSAVAYLAYAVPILFVLFRLSSSYKAGLFSWKDWAPVMLLGVLLLNPRLMEYDLEALALPMALVLWRLLRRTASAPRRFAFFLSILTALNLLAVLAWKPTACVALLSMFLCGALYLKTESVESASLIGNTASDRSAMA